MNESIEPMVDRWYRPRVSNSLYQAALLLWYYYILDSCAMQLLPWIVSLIVVTLRHSLERWTREQAGHKRKTI